MIDRFERFSVAISDISRYWHKLATEEMQRYGLKGSHAIYLTTLYRFAEGVTAPQLGELCGKDKADVSRMMTIMEDKGLVTKQGDNRKLYRGLLKLTAEGRRAAEHVRERARLAVECGGKGLDEAERATFYSVLEIIAGNLRELSRAGLPASGV